MMMPAGTHSVLEPAVGGGCHPGQGADGRLQLGLLQLQGLGGLPAGNTWFSYLCRLAVAADARPVATAVMSTRPTDDGDERGVEGGGEGELVSDAVVIHQLGDIFTVWINSITVWIG